MCHHTIDVINHENYQVQVQVHVRVHVHILENSEINICHDELFVQSFTAQ
jgi:hypothetical protein